MRRRVASIVALVASACGPLAAQPTGAAPACTPSRPTPEVAAAITPGPRRLAVLGFDTPSGDQSSHDLAFALGQRVSRRLRELRPLDVIARELPPGTGVASALNGRGADARYLLTGTVDRVSDDIRLTIRLLDGRTGAATVERRFVHPRDSLASLEAVVALAVAERTLGSLTREDRARLSAPLSGDVEAYERYLEALVLLERPQRTALEQAIAALDGAWRRDPAFTEAWIRLALAYARFLGRPDVAPDDEEAILAGGLAAADRALALDPRASDAWVARAWLMERRSPRALTGVRAAYERALAVNPSNAEAHRRLGRLLAQLGETEQGSAHLRSALLLEPEYARTLTDLAEVRLRTGGHDEACVLLNLAVDAGPSSIDAYIFRAMARMPLREYRGAWADAETAARLGSPVQGEAVAVLVDLAAGDSAAARARAGRLAGRSLVRGSHALSAREGWMLALAFAGVGEPDRALAALERVAPRGVALWSALQDPGLASLRRHPRFAVLESGARPAEATP